jgi:uncharacterized protein YegJ (DUF2314 family)
MRPLFSALAVLAMLIAPAAAQTALQKAEGDELFVIPRNDPDMAAAMKKARSTLPEFLATMKSPTGTMRGFAVKVAPREGKETEYVWITPFEPKDGGFSGIVGNTPRAMRNFKRGQTLQFAEREIVDWLYMDGDKMKGNFTSCPLLKKEPPAQAKAVMDRFGLDCGF